MLNATLVPIRIVILLPLLSLIIASGCNKEDMEEAVAADPEELVLDLEEEKPTPDDDFFKQADGFANEGNLDSAIVYMQKSSQQYDSDSTWENFVHTKRKLGEYTWRQAAYAESKKYLVEALNTTIQHTGESTIDVATLYNNLGNVSDFNGEYDDALEYHYKALALREKLLPADHPDLASTHNNLGIVYRIIGDYAKSIENHNESLRIKKIALGGGDPRVGNSFHNIGVAFAELGDYDLALEYLEQGKQIWSDTLGPQHPNIAFSYNSIGVIYNDIGGLRQIA